MNDGTKIKYGEIWWVQCSPSIGNEFRDRHPVVVIQNEQLIRKGDGGVITVMIMSSYKGKKGPYDFLVESSKESGLMKPTLLKVEYITSYDKSRFLRKIGILDDGTMEKVRKYLNLHFSLT